MLLAGKYNQRNIGVALSVVSIAPGNLLALDFIDGGFFIAIRQIEVGDDFRHAARDGISFYDVGQCDLAIFRQHPRNLVSQQAFVNVVLVEQCVG